MLACVHSDLLAAEDREALVVLPAQLGHLSGVEGGEELSEGWRVEVSGGERVLWRDPSHGGGLQIESLLAILFERQTHHHAIEAILKLLHLFVYILDFRELV